MSELPEIVNADRCENRSAEWTHEMKNLMY
jgi:hypothetical protein